MPNIIEYQIYIEPMCIQIMICVYHAGRVASLPHAESRFWKTEIIKKNLWKFPVLNKMAQYKASSLIHSLTSLGQLARLTVGNLKYQTGELHEIKKASFMSRSNKFLSKPQHNPKTT